MASWTVKELESFDHQIQERVDANGLTYFPVEFMITDAHEMLSYMAYDGMPAHFPHWSYGKAYEKTKTLYDYGMTGLPYEMVINAKPAIAYLMRDNSLCLQVLTMAHVYGHVDFFTNNFYFSATRPEETIGTFKNHANRVRAYRKDANIGPDKVEATIDACRSIMFDINRNWQHKRLTQKQQVERALDRAKPVDDRWESIHPKQEWKEPDTHKVPIEPDADLLLFIRDNNPFLETWERDLMTIVWEEAQYFLPMMETKIMNEGWASYWHDKLIKEIDPPSSMMIEYALHNAHVVSRVQGMLNPYYIGKTIWTDIEKRLGRDVMFQAREAERDQSFLRRFLTEELVREMHLVEYGVGDDDESVYVVKTVADDDEDHWKRIRDKMISEVGMGLIPVIKVEDSDVGQSHTLLLKHYHDGRDLFRGYTEPTMRYIQQLWRRPVVLETMEKGKKMHVICDGNTVGGKWI